MPITVIVPGKDTAAFENFQRLALLAAGCASSLTSASPRQTVIVEGEKRLSGTTDLRFDAFKSREPGGCG